MRITIARSTLIAAALFLLGFSLCFASWYERRCSRDILDLRTRLAELRRASDCTQDGYDRVVYAMLFHPLLAEGSSHGTP